MATFTFLKRQLAEIKRAIIDNPMAAVWFQPTHHGGCFQFVLKDEVLHEFFCKQTTGYPTLIKDHMVPSMELTQPMKDYILHSEALRVIVNKKGPKNYGFKFERLHISEARD